MTSSRRQVRPAGELARPGAAVAVARVTPVPSSGRQVRLAGELVRLGADIVVVGGTARLLRTGAGEPSDLDVVVTSRALPRLARALDRLGCPVPERVLRRGRPARVVTGWGPLDVFVGDPPPARRTTVLGCEVRVEAGDR